MSDLIHLLPDSIANQIAAGEVIQRPSSAVKELLENSIDAGATHVQLYIKDAGKQLIQVIDNGKGMSETDARMAFERHATSKIKNIDDLFSLHTMGFRGEALASIAAVSQVEIKTKRHEDELGTKIQIENSTVVYKSLEATPIGTNISLKNLFFNVPARRKFLKSNTTELKHLVDEFIRVALAFPQVHLQMYNEGKLLHNFESGNSKTRIVSIFGNSWNAKLVPVSEKTDYISIEGFVGKPDTAIKTKNNQYFIVNQRFIKNYYLHHAVQRAFEGMIGADEHPAYVLYLNINPDKIDVNVHPTKQEIKFDDEKLIYSFLHAAVKHALGKYSIAPSIDFSLDKDISKLSALNAPFSKSDHNKTINGDLYKTFSQPGVAHKIDKSVDKNPWKEALDFNIEEKSSARQVEIDHFFDDTSTQETNEINISSPSMFQWDKKYIVSPMSSGLVFIKQHEAHIRVLYDQFLALADENKSTSQRLVFPVKLTFAAHEIAIVDSMLKQLNVLGFDIEFFGNNEFIIHAIPSLIPSQNIESVFKKFISDFSQNENASLDIHQKIFYNISKNIAVKEGQQLLQKDMESIISQLFSTSNPSFSPKGDRIFFILKTNILEELFK